MYLTGNSKKKKSCMTENGKIWKKIRRKEEVFAKWKAGLSRLSAKITMPRSIDEHVTFQIDGILLSWGRRKKIDYAESRYGYRYIDERRGKKGKTVEPKCGNWMDRSSERHLTNVIRCTITLYKKSSDIFDRKCGWEAGSRKR